MVCRLLRRGIGASGFVDDKHTGDRESARTRTSMRRIHATFFAALAAGWIVDESMRR
jgi:hypothetical protein